MQENVLKLPQPVATHTQSLLGGASFATRTRNHGWRVPNQWQEFYECCPPTTLLESPFQSLSNLRQGQCCWWRFEAKTTLTVEIRRPLKKWWNNCTTEHWATLGTFGNTSDLRNGIVCRKRRLNSLEWFLSWKNSRTMESRRDHGRAKKTRKTNHTIFSLSY